MNLQEVLQSLYVPNDNNQPVNVPTGVVQVIGAQWEWNNFVTAAVIIAAIFAGWYGSGGSGGWGGTQVETLRGGVGCGRTGIGTCY